METLNLTTRPHPLFPSIFIPPFNLTPLKTHYNTITNKNDTFKIKASTPPFYPTKPPEQNPKKFHEKDAFPNSIPIHNKNPHAIYRDIQNFANQNKLKEALAILDYLDHRGIPTNATTFSSLIAACVRVKSIEAAKQVHAHIRINGLEENEFLQTKLVHMYAGCGSIEDAQKVFDNMRVRSVYPWNALLRGNVVLGNRNHREVMGSFLEMRASGVELNVYSFSCLIKSLAGGKALFQGLKTHGILVKNGLLGSCIVKTSLIDMYFKCGKIKLASSVFEEVEERDVVVWGAMIAGFAHNRLQREALEYTRWMVREGISVNSVILTSILPVIGEVSARNIGREVHAYVIKTKEYSKQLFIQSSLVDMYCKCGDMVSGRKVFYGSMERNTISWTALLSGYVANGRLDQALRSIIWMQQEGFKPDIVTVATVLPVCGKLRALKQGKELHCYAVKNKFLPAGVSIATSLMMMYSKCGNLEYCVRLFDNMERKNVISWTAMIECYIESRRLDEALGVFRLMQLSKHRPDSVTIARALSLSGEIKNEKIGKEIHGHVLRKDLESIPFVSAEIVRMYGKWREIDKAKLVFDGVRVKGSMTWTAIIEAYGCNGDYKEAIHVFEEMILGGFSPNQFTFKVVLCVCEEGGFADDALRLFTLMTRKYKIEASEEHYSSIINVLTRFGRVEEAEKFIKLKSSLP
ncbi:hypothetical protein BUALT_Bualt15G0090800 [Buddleja alternifolia]|uniref:Pentatricopeptide repeat-containing protein n=1 Tax=Buddleja alternifolia TaxID=168488 RepID=A0AAV6WKD8_9LAMI|nr:hypothetical protein BUALT_Bualt15G0090800 [Buddleja alternifolia]